MNHSILVDRIDTLIRFFLYVLIFWLPYSPAVIESCVIICIILWLLKRSILLSTQKESTQSTKEKILQILKAFKPESTFLNKPIGFFLFACILSVTSSAFFGQSLHNFLTKTLEWFIIYFLIVEVFKDKKHIYTALVVFAFTAFSTATDSLIQFYITHKDIFLGREIEPASRATAGFKTSNGLGGYLTIFIPALCAWIFLGKQRLHYRLLVSLICLIAIWSLIITFSRGAWIGIFFGGMFLLFFILLPKERVGFYFALGLLAVTVSFILAFMLILTSSSGQEFLGRHQTIQWRLNLWGNSIVMIKDKPFFGHGINTFMKLYQAYRQHEHMGPTYAHNCYIQLAAETGVIGLFGFLWIIGKIFHQTLGKIKLNFTQDWNLAVLATGLLSGVFAYLVHSFFDTHFYSLQLSAYLWFIVGILVAIGNIFQVPRSKGEV